MFSFTQLKTSNYVVNSMYIQTSRGPIMAQVNYKKMCKSFVWLHWINLI